MRLSDILGHAQPRALLLRAVASRSVPQSLLFDGPEGIGKRTTALALAAAINCQQPGIDGDACGTCSSCKRIARAQHPDIVSLVPNEKGTITVEMARDVIGQATYRPFEARRRVVVIDEADALLPPAQNALLKTLEEPPPSSMFVLVSARPDSLLETVRSRCPRVRFGRLGAADLAEVLVRHCGVARAESAGLAAMGDGSVARALAQETGELVEARAAALSLLQGVAGRPPAASRLRLAQQLAEVPKKKGAGTDREVLARRLEALSLLVRDLGAMSAPGDAGATVLANPDLQGDLAGLARHFDTGRVLAAFDTVEQARRSLERYQAAKVVADWLACEM
ncbi:DNA polymerase III subunit delta' [Luteitalea sp. TBR-22]|uniref:DNA polymerase III subunit delta' n=1 Tax=Luteitalea sp. TBR-22 TaxID=2802971 RepID=UPI001AFA31F9|nr:DNA polymerase III subunit delta' [Luteitalea sp. TBR-22]BCS34741.1 DNA polymerase III subunit delta' [Luteitalea sp. TBR-22]